MTVKSLRKQLAAAIAMTLVATVALGSSTYAWFAINSKVTATGMNFTTKVSQNLFIADSTHTKTGFEAESSFGTALVQSKSALLEPASTTDGIDYYFTSVQNVLGSGNVSDAVNKWYQYDDATADGTTKDADFTGMYDQSDAVAFVDYVYQLKAVNPEADSLYLDLTKLTLTYGPDTAGTEKNTAFRAAVFVQDITSGGATATNTVGNYSVGGTTAVLFNSEFGSDHGVNFDAGKAVKSTGRDTVSYKANTNSLATVTTGTKYYKVVVRVWLEGEDTNCNNTTFAALDDGKWSLDCEWQLHKESENNDSVQYLTISEITTANYATVSIANNAVGDKAFTISGIDFYEVESAEYDSKQVYVGVATGSAAPSEANYGTAKFYIVDESMYPMEITHLVTVTD